MLCVFVTNYTTQFTNKINQILMLSTIVHLGGGRFIRRHLFMKFAFETENYFLRRNLEVISSEIKHLLVGFRYDLYTDHTSSEGGGMVTSLSQPTSFNLCL